MLTMKLNRLFFAIALSVSACATVDAAGGATSNPVIDDRGSQVEILPQLQASAVAAPTGSGAAHELARVATPVRLSNATKGVVYNHAMRAQGLINGEITFAIKGMTPGAYPEAQYPGFKKLANPNVYLVVARTPSEFVAVFERLKARSDVEWVEPQIEYVGAAASPQAVIESARQIQPTK
ncbi:hypothetical protein [Niveibacterium sp.]|uniref:hypothetical protein n=1 Tax=Niveibacterium sp. TaxID=2017444 RepID=UPI0035AFD14E